MPSVYIETSIVSYATAWPSSLPHILVRQEDARRWWDEYSSRYDLFVSQAVLDEASAGGMPMLPKNGSECSMAFR